MAHCKLSKALTDALKHYEWVTGEAFAKAPILKIHNDLAFWAMVKPSGSNIELHVNTGVTATLEKLWSQAWESSILTLPDGKRIFTQSDDDAIEYMVHLSMVWLMLHELMHIQLSHFSIVGQASLVGLSRSKGDDKIFPHVLKQFPKTDHQKVRQCIELQADAEATDLFLEPYSDDYWDILRMRCAAICAVMVLIEKSSAQNQVVDIHHPMATTRFFTLIGHLFQMMLYPKAELEYDGDMSMLRNANKVTSKEIEAFMQKVAWPVVNDAVMLATYSEAKEIIIDMGDQGKLFQDILKAQYHENLKETRFKTSAGQQWLELIRINEKLMDITKLREA